MTFLLLIDQQFKLGASGEHLLSNINSVANFTEKKGMVKDDSIRKQMFASIASWQASELSQKHGAIVGGPYFRSV